MITPKQHKEIFNYLFSKKLPLDLLVEVEDHMKEQISALMDEGTSFENAFTQTKLNWQKDLSEKWMLFRGYRTQLERETARQTNREKNLTALKWVLPYIAVVVALTFYKPELAKFLIVAGNFLVGFYCIYLMIFNFKIFKSTNKSSNRKNISILQRSGGLLVVGAQGIILGVSMMNKGFLIFQAALTKISDLDWDNILFLLTSFVYIYAGIIGILYFRDYKKTVEILKQKINFKL